MLFRFFLFFFFISAWRKYTMCLKWLQNGASLFCKIVLTETWWDLTLDQITICAQISELWLVKITLDLHFHIFSSRFPVCLVLCPFFLTDNSLCGRFIAVLLFRPCNQLDTWLKTFVISLSIFLQISQTQFSVALVPKSKWPMASKVWIWIFNKQR